MSMDKIIKTLDNLDKMHKSLLDLASKKTQIIVDGDMEALDKMIKNEQAHVAAVEQLEKQRQKMVTDYLAAKGLASADKPTVSDLIAATTDEQEKQQLVQLRQSIIETIENLKKKNIMNQKLVYQSLQFVNMSLDLMRPQAAPQASTMNYSSKEVQGSRVNSQKSNFDSGI